MVWRVPVPATVVGDQDRAVRPDGPAGPGVGEADTTKVFFSDANLIPPVPAAVVGGQNRSV